MESFIVFTGKQNSPKACYVPEQTNLNFWLPVCLQLPIFTVCSWWYVLRWYQI